MQLLKLTLPSLAENLALDEALLNQAEQSDAPLETLRLWESPSFGVVLGRSSDLQSEVQHERCKADGVEILRRCSGGASVVVGPGCLMYSVVLSSAFRPALKDISQCHSLVLEKLRQATQKLDSGVAVKGICDLVLGDKKFGGNALRCRRRSVLYHGTLLYDFPLARIADWLADAPRQPDYRQGRGHTSFVTNLPAKRSQLEEALVAAWDARTPALNVPTIPHP